MKIAFLFSVALFALTACDNLPGDNHTHSTLIGDPQGAAGNPLGASGAYVCGVSISKDDAEHRNELLRASHDAETVPATTESAKHAATADLNLDGFVTLDEILAMRNSGMSDAEIITRVAATGYRFSVSKYQEQFLRDRGVDKSVVNAMRNAQ